jgi:hypothetical protein
MTTEKNCSPFVIRHSGFVIPAMFLAHSIRLRDPWQRAATEEGGTRWSRRFHRPTSLEPDDQLLLVLSGLPPDAIVRVNGHDFSLPPSAFPPPPSPLPAQFDLTPLLADANEIEINLPPPLPTSDLRPPTSPSFPYDARLAVIGHS